MHFLSVFPIALLPMMVSALPIKLVRPRSQIIARGSTDTSFAADPSIDTKAIYDAAQAANSDILATYRAEQGQPDDVHVYGDWMKLPGASAIHFTADMDVDCDGADYLCSGNTDGQPQTNFGHLDARVVPWYVIPQSLADKQKVKANAVGAVICNGKMFYGIFGDANGDTPEVIGEASLLLAQTCFPDSDISGNNGHTQKDVLYIVFPDEAPTGVEDKSIDIGTLKTLGDKQARLLQTALNLSAGSPTGNNSTASDDPPSPSASCTDTGTAPCQSQTSGNGGDSTTPHHKHHEGLKQ